MVELTLKPCPFCGISPILATTPGWIWHDANGCRLVGKHPIGWWQSRIDTPPPSSTPEVVEAVARAIQQAEREMGKHVAGWDSLGPQTQAHLRFSARAAIAALPPSNSPDGGRSPSGPGYSAEPEPSCTVSAVPVSIPNAFALLQQEIQTDQEYAWAWFCNIAMPIIDAIRLSHEEAQTAAAHIMATLFDCDITKHSQFKGVKSFAQDYHEIRVAAERAEDASAIEARQGGDATEIAAPSSDESAVPEGQTPESGIPSNMIGEAIEALEPFAGMSFKGSIWEGEFEPDDSIVHCNIADNRTITLGDFRKARATLSKLRGEG